MTANAITVKGYTNATGIHLTEGGRNLTISDMQVSAGISGNAAGIIAAPGRDNPVSTAGNLENIRIDNLEVSGGADATGIFANSITKSGQNENIIGNITVSSENGLANGILPTTLTSPSAAKSYPQAKTPTPTEFGRKTSFT